jgi:hypothetical protein
MPVIGIITNLLNTCHREAGYRLLMNNDFAYLYKPNNNLPAVFSLHNITKESLEEYINNEEVKDG